MKYYLIDASAIIHYYIPLYPKLTSNIDQIIKQRQEGKSFLFMPNFCIAEVFNVFAKYYYRWRKLKREEYEKCCKEFRDAIHNAKLIYHYELNRYHILNIDYIVPFEHQFLIKKRFNKDEEEKEWFLSTFDILFISMGIELVRMMGFENVFLISCDTRIKSICDVLKNLDLKTREKFQIPSYIVYPKAILLKDFHP